MPGINRHWRCIIAQVNKKQKAEDVAKDLESVNNRIEALLREIPTNNHRIIGELYMLISKQSELVGADAQKESGTMFLDRARRIAGFLKQQYLNALYEGNLRMSVSESEGEDQ